MLQTRNTNSKNVSQVQNYRNAAESLSNGLILIFVSYRFNVNGRGSTPEGDGIHTNDSEDSDSELDIETTSISESFQEEKSDTYDSNIEQNIVNPSVKRPHATVANWLNQNHPSMFDHPHNLHALLVPFNHSSIGSFNQYSNPSSVATTGKNFLSLSNQ